MGLGYGAAAMMFEPELVSAAELLLTHCRQDKIRLATAESCTGGLVAALLTSIAGSSDVFIAGIVSYSNSAKTALLGVTEKMIRLHGAVSEDVARKMAEGALQRTGADIAIAVTGIAGPGGATPDKAVGQVHIAVARQNGSTIHRKLALGDVGRENVRLLSVAAALELAMLA